MWLLCTDGGSGATGLLSIGYLRVVHWFGSDCVSILALLKSIKLSQFALSEL
jgi:hypothetical protein